MKPETSHGLAFSEFRGYEDWQTVAVSQTAAVINVILANPAMIAAGAAALPLEYIDSCNEKKYDQSNITKPESLSFNDKVKYSKYLRNQPAGRKK